ncbi:hypothetical protein ABH935_009876 [Catenulispora sp. GAS73]
MRITQLTTKHATATDNGVELLLAEGPILLPSAFGDLVMMLIDDRRGATPTAPEDSVWLYPGSRLGRPLAPSDLTRRLRELGISPTLGRNTALMEMAAEMPAAVITRMLGISLDRATRWTQDAGNTRLGYAAQLARRAGRLLRSRTIEPQPARHDIGRDLYDPPPMSIGISLQLHQRLRTGKPELSAYHSAGLVDLGRHQRPVLLSPADVLVHAATPVFDRFARYCGLSRWPGMPDATTEPSSRSAYQPSLATAVGVAEIPVRGGVRVPAQPRRHVHGQHQPTVRGLR